MEVVRLGAVLDSIKTLKDGSFKVTFESGELPPAIGANLLAMRQKYGWLIFAHEDTPQVEIPDEPPKEFRNEKTPSQRLRAVLYVWWQQAKPCDDFEDFYRKKMEQVIQWVKDKLDETPET